jgi:glycosyltransferase involved in cell wall biosynthesis
MLKDKGVFEFIAAAKKLKESLFGHCVFTLIGGIDLMNPSAITESELINELEDEYIIWLGHRNDIMDVYNSTDIACLPSYREGLPKSLVEAMAMSCPIVSTDVPGCRECVEDGVNGFLVPSRNSDLLADRILLLVGNSELRIKMGHASRAKMEKEMSLQTVIDQTFTVYGS